MVAVVVDGHGVIDGGDGGGGGGGGDSAWAWTQGPRLAKQEFYH